MDTPTPENPVAKPSRTRGRTPRLSAPGTRQRIITVRLPAELHSRLVAERSRPGGKSLNAIVIETLNAALTPAAPPQLLITKSKG